MNRRVGRVAFGTAALAFGLLGCRAILGIEDLEDDTALQDGAVDGAPGDADVSADTGNVFDSGFSSDGCAYDDDASALHGMIQVAVGETFSCALGRDRTTVYCWGALEGSLVKGSKLSVQPLTTGTSSLISRIFAGDDFVCALTDSQEVRCWGLNNVGQVDPTAPLDAGQVNRPVALQHPLSAAAGGDHSCVTAPTSVQCWGANASHQLGSTVPTATSTNVPGTADAAVVAVGTFHSCALLSDAGVRCWGDDLKGQLGNATAVDAAFPPSPAFEGLTVIGLAAGGLGTCAKTPSGYMCVGRNNEAQLGFEAGPTTAPVTAPRLLDRVDPPTALESLAMTSSFSCALTTSGTLHCFGQPLGHDLTGDEGPNAIVQLAGGLDLGRVTAVAGWSSPSQLGFSQNETPPAAHICAIVAGNCDGSGYVYCWGTNNNGELGNGLLGDGGQNFVAHPQPVLPQ